MNGPVLAGCACGKSAMTRADDGFRIVRSGVSFPAKSACCGTGWDDHFWSGDEDSDWRCHWCDRRSGSHGSPITKFDDADWLKAKVFTEALWARLAPDRAADAATLAAFKAARAA